MSPLWKNGNILVFLQIRFQHFLVHHSSKRWLEKHLRNCYTLANINRWTFNWIVQDTIHVPCDTQAIEEHNEQLVRRSVNMYTCCLLHCPLVHHVTSRSSSQGSNFRFKSIELKLIPREEQPICSKVPVSLTWYLNLQLMY